MFIFRTLAYWLMFSMTVSYAAEVTSPERAFSILRDNCHQCHSQAVTMGGLNLTSREAALKVIVPGDIEKSKLMDAVQRKGPIVMPPTKALPAADVDALRAEGDEPLDLRFLITVGGWGEVEVQPVLPGLRRHRRATPADLRAAVW